MIRLNIEANGHRFRVWSHTRQGCCRTVAVHLAAITGVRTILYARERV